MPSWTFQWTLHLGKSSRTLTNLIMVMNKRNNYGGYTTLSTCITWVRRVLACPVRTLRIKITGDYKSFLAGKRPLKGCGSGAERSLNTAVTALWLAEGLHSVAVFQSTTEWQRKADREAGSSVHVGTVHGVHRRLSFRLGDWGWLDGGNSSGSRSAETVVSRRDGSRVIGQHTAAFTTARRIYYRVSSFFVVS